MQPTSIIVTSLEAARRQLRTAIELWSVEGDPVSIHSLTFAAHHIIHDLNRLNRGPHLLLDHPNVRPEKRDEFIAIVKRDANFFKHADRRVKKNRMVETEVEFSPTASELFMALAIQGLLYLGDELTDIELAFSAWHRLHYLDLITDAGQHKFNECIDIKSADNLRTLSKKAFLDRFIAIRRSGAMGR